MDTKIAIPSETMPKILMEMNAIFTLVGREIKITLKSPSRLLIAILWPVLTFGMYGNQLAQNMGNKMGYDFTNFMLVGQLINALFMMSMYTIGTLAEDRENDFTQEIFVSPVSRYSIIFGKIIGGAFPSYLQYFSTIFIGLALGTQLTASQFLLMLAISPLMCIAAGSIGVLVIGCIRNPNTANMFLSIIASLQMLVSGAMIPVKDSTGLMAIVSHLMPMTYAVDLSRGLCDSAAAKQSETVMLPPWLNLCIVLGFTVVFFVVGTWQFVQSEKNK
ncbi:MAG: ABC transporter permease [Oscillospiraceae bacterium]|jgi:ABC-2 type transport system permease protein|nr:ABC transporter permease [Oscillospiraceae bacterium]